MLHSFYTGVENILKRVSVELDGQPVRGEAWHRDLLRGMTRDGPGRPAWLSASLHESLLEYLRFRHVFRNAYSFDLQWEKMAPLVQNAEATLTQLEQELDGLGRHGVTEADVHLDRDSGFTSRATSVTRTT